MPVGWAVTRIFRCLLLIFSLLAIAGGPAGRVLAADPAAGADLSVEVGRLAAAIDRLASLYEQDRQQAEQDALSRKLDTAIAYLNFRSRRIELLEQDLQQLRTGRDRLASAFMQMEERRNLIEAQARTTITGSSREREKERDEFQLKMKMMQERVDRSEQEIVILENKIQELQTEISSVESFVQRNLEF